MRTLVALLFACCISQPVSALQVLLQDGTGQAIPGGTVSAGETARSPPPLPNAVAVDQRDKRFEPHVTIVAPGAAVRFPNSDDTRHHVYSFSGDNAFELKLYRTGDSPPVVFEQPGIVTLGCNIHDNMKAYVVVTEDAGTVSSDAQGLASLPWLPAGEPVTLTVWHSQLERPIDFELSAEETASGRVSLSLPFSWVDPQLPRSSSQLESLLKRYSRDAN